MKLINIFIGTSMFLGTAIISFAANYGNINNSLDNTDTITTTNNIFKSDFIKPFTNTYMSLINKKHTWGPQERIGQLYLDIGTSGLVGTSNSPSGAAANFTFGYNINNYLGIQYFQLVGIDFAGLGEGSINFSNNTMFTPYLVGGAGWANLSGQATGAWDTGGGLKFELSRDIQANVNYRYIQTMAPKSSGYSGRGGTNVIGAGITWFFGKNTNPNNYTTYIQDNGAKTSADTIESILTLNETKYELPKGIEECEWNFNLNKDGAACYIINGKDVKIYLNTKFAYDSTILNEKGKNAILSFVKYIQDKDIDIVTIKGYSSQGKIGEEFELYNQKLSEKRSEAVYNYMKELGLSRNQIITKGFGYTNTLDGIKKSDVRNQRVQASVTVPFKEN